MGSLCTCFQGNRGLQNTGRLDFLFSMCCTALWQNTADPSNDSKTPHCWPRCCSAVFDLKLHPCVHVAAYFNATQNNTSWRCTMIERKPQIGQYAWIKHTWSFAGDVTVCAPPPPLLTNLSPLKWSAPLVCSQSAACLTCGRRDRKMPFSVGDISPVISWIYYRGSLCNEGGTLRCSAKQRLQQADSN